jgi:hypothetical protein
MLATPFGRCLVSMSRDSCFDGMLIMSSHCHRLCGLCWPDTVIS